MKKLLLFAVVGLLTAQTTRPGKIVTTVSTTSTAGPSQELYCTSTAEKVEPMNKVPALTINCYSGGYPTINGLFYLAQETAAGKSLKMTVTRGEDVIEFTLTKAATAELPDQWQISANGVSGSGYFQ